MNDADRELIELAAKAAGHKVKGWINDKLAGWDAVTGNEFAGWNPLENDGDAFSLMVALSIDVSFNDEHGIIYANESMTQTTGIIWSKAAATRGAIVLASAEIGRGMKDA